MATTLGHADRELQSQPHGEYMITLADGGRVSSGPANRACAFAGARASDVKITAAALSSAQ
jgi:hypothetical protein